MIPVVKVDEGVMILLRHLREAYQIPMLRNDTVRLITQVLSGEVGKTEEKTIPTFPSEQELNEAILEVDAYLEFTLKHDKKACQCEVCRVVRGFATSPLIVDYLKTMLDFEDEQFQQAANSCLVFMLTGMLVGRDR